MLVTPIGVGEFVLTFISNARMLGQFIVITDITEQLLVVLFSYPIHWMVRGAALPCMIAALLLLRDNRPGLAPLCSQF